MVTTKLWGILGNRRQLSGTVIFFFFKWNKCISESRPTSAIFCNPGPCIFWLSDGGHWPPIRQSKNHFWQSKNAWPSLLGAITLQQLFLYPYLKVGTWICKPQLISSDLKNWHKAARFHSSKSPGATIGVCRIPCSQGATGCWMTKLDKN